MKKHFITAAILFFSLAVSTSANAQNKSHATIKFLDDIEVSIALNNTAIPKAKGPQTETLSYTYKKEIPAAPTASFIESASALQFKYALLIDTDVEQILNLKLFSLIDEWFGTPYRYGGSTKTGIDCSAFMQTLYAGLYGITLPRVAKDQHKTAKAISRTEIREGDLVFFNTTGGVSHVGMYLQNNKFVHAASGGVMISDLYDEYWMKRFIGVGRIDGVTGSSFFSQP